MPPLDWIKLAFILPLFFGLGPMLGVAVKGKHQLQLRLFGLMCFMTINGLIDAGNWGVTLDSVETYRGHTKGFHFYFNQIIAIGLMTARWLEDRRGFRWMPPGMFIYGLYVAASCLSLVNAPRLDYAFMAIHKMTFFVVVAIAAFNTLRTVRDLQFFTTAMGITMVWESIIVLKMKFLDHRYQVHGTFEHQNSLAMYTILIGLPLLAVALGPKFKGQGWCVAGFLACAVIIQAALSRASLVMFAIGVAGVSVISLAEKPTSRRLTVLGIIGSVAALGLALTIDTIINRFHDEGNDASAELRVVLNVAAREMEAAHPLGIGWNNYAEVINAPYPYAEVVYDWIRGRGMTVHPELANAPVESHYYLLLSENGYPGLIGWYLVMAAGVIRNFLGFVRFRHSFERCLCLGIMISTSLNYIQSTLERTLTQPRNLMLWLLLYAITGRMALMRRAQIAARRSGALPGSDADGTEGMPGPASSGAAPRVTPKRAWPSPAAWHAAPPPGLPAAAASAGPSLPFPSEPPAAS